MREILFRGKAIDGNWYYGVPLIFTEDYVCITAPHTYNKKVEANTIGQITGLSDKNGKKIFEGDIVVQPVRETRKHSPCIVEFRNGKFQAHYVSENRFFDRYYDINSYTKVIGNIHDNPELLKGGVQE